MNTDCQLLYETYVTEVTDMYHEIVEQMADKVIDVMMSAKEDASEIEGKGIQMPPYAKRIGDHDYWKPSEAFDDDVDSLIGHVLDDVGMPVSMKKLFGPRIRGRVLQKLSEKN